MVVGFLNVRNPIVRKGFFICRLVIERLKPIAIIAIQAGLCTQPYKATRIFKYYINLRITQSVMDSYMTELNNWLGAIQAHRS